MISTPADLRRAILPLDPGGAIHRQLDADLGGGRRWYACQQEHLLGWLAEYDGPGFYGRADPNRSAAFIYNHFQCAPGLAWLAEAAGVDSALVTAGCDAARATGRRSAAQCGAFRRLVPWGLVEQALTGAVVTPRLPKKRLGSD